MIRRGKKLHFTNFLSSFTKGETLKNRNKFAKNISRIFEYQLTEFNIGLLFIYFEVNDNVKEYSVTYTRSKMQSALE